MWVQELAVSGKLSMRSPTGTDKHIAAITQQPAAHFASVTGSAKDVTQGLQEQSHQRQHSAQQLLDGWQHKLDDMTRQLAALRSSFPT